MYWKHFGWQKNQSFLFIIQMFSFQKCLHLHHLKGDFYIQCVLAPADISYLHNSRQQLLMKSPSRTLFTMKIERNTFKLEIIIFIFSLNSIFTNYNVQQHDFEIEMNDSLIFIIAFGISFRKLVVSWIHLFISLQSMARSRGAVAFRNETTQNNTFTDLTPKYSDIM